jgi:EAL domain-containing protein (putative c-di-GMP-specific phosphodiesterase class I)
MQRYPLSRPPAHEGDEAAKLSGAPASGKTGLERLVDPEDLRVVFQPIVSLSNGRVYAYEALVRCRIGSLSNPTVLFEQAARMGCVAELGRSIREIAVPLASGKPLFVNVHPHELSDRWLVRPDDPIFAHDQDVFIEITEAVPMQHFDLCLRVVRELRQRGGVHLVVDDLGAGYSNLKSIADLEPRVVKLDRGLVAGIDTNRRQRCLVAGVVRLCADLGAEVVAEGVETMAEYEALLEVGAQLGQGFLFSKPGFPLPPVTWPPGKR